MQLKLPLPAGEIQSLESIEEMVERWVHAKLTSTPCTQTVEALTLSALNCDTTQEGMPPSFQSAQHITAEMNNGVQITPSNHSKQHYNIINRLK